MKNSDKVYKILEDKINGTIQNIEVIQDGAYAWVVVCDIYDNSKSLIGRKAFMVYPQIESLDILEVSKAYTSIYRQHLKKTNKTNPINILK